MVINVCLPGAIDPMDSYGIVGIELARHLTRLGVYVNLFAMGKREMDSQDAETAAIVNQPVKPARGAIMLGYPTNYAKHTESQVHKGPQVAVTMFESSVCPSAWAQIMNTMDAVVTPSTFCETVFRDCGVTVPIHTIPLGIGEIYKPFRRPHRDKLTFLTFLDRGARKGGLAAQHAFLLAFGDRTDVHLILKRRKPNRIINFSNENMTMIQQDYTEQEMYELYCSADVMIFATKGEGFGLPCREFAATGGVAMATDWSGTRDDIDEWGWPLPYEIVAADWTGNKNLEGQDLGVWAEPNIEGVAQELRDLEERRSECLDAAWRKAQVTREMYSWRKFAEQVLEVYQGVSNGSNPSATRQPTMYAEPV